MYLKEFYRFFKHLFNAKELILTLIVNDFKKQYLGSYLGLVWAFLQPMTFMFVIWFVFDIGMRAGPPVGDTPFFLWLICGMVPWFFISGALTSGTGAVVSNAFLVKKVHFRVSVLPMIKISSELIIHVALLGFMMIAFLLYGYTPSVYWLQIPYYLICTIVLLLGLTWLSSAIRVFVKDIGNFVAVLMQMGFWATPIFWSLDMLPEEYRWILKLNPAYYIVEGYRNTFVTHEWFWEDMTLTAYYLGFALVSLLLGAIVFKRLRPHFGDVL